VDAREYNGSTTVPVSSTTVEGKATYDAEPLKATCTSIDYLDAASGTNKQVVVNGLTLVGVNAHNYRIADYVIETTDVSTPNITPRQITAKVSVNDKVYDGTKVAEIYGAELLDTISADDVTLINGSAEFAQTGVGTGISVSFSGFTLSGADAYKYILVQPADTVADITPRSLYVELAAADKVYDGTTAATVAGAPVFIGAVSGDALTVIDVTASFDSKNVGDGKPVTFTGLLGGVDSANYTLAPLKDTIANIIPRALTVSGIAVANKLYDGTTAANFSGATLNTVLASDVVVLNTGNAEFYTKNTGVGKTVKFSGFTLGGRDSANYSLTQPANGTADITVRPVTVIVDADDKVYDGTTTATVIASTLKDTIGADDVKLISGTAAFADRNAGRGKRVSFSGYSLTGADAANYSLTQPTDTTADITVRPVTARIAALDKAYDGTTLAIVAGAPVMIGAVSGDDLTVSGGAAAFDTKYVGANKTVTFTGYRLDGADTANYALAGVSDTVANITLRELNIINLVAESKTYDGTVAAKFSGGAFDTAFAGDNVNIIAGVAEFYTKSAGTDKSVKFSGFAIGGADSANYTLASQPTNGTASITAKSVTVIADAADKVYDGTTTATVIASTLKDTVAIDDVKLISGAAAFADRNAGTGKRVSFGGYSLTGADAANYSLTQPTDTTADITVRPVSVSPVAEDRAYDGTTLATVAATPAIVGAVVGDDLTLTSGSAEFDTKYVGTGKTVTFTGYALAGTDKANYSLTVNDTVATVTAKALSIVGLTADDKTYDGVTATTFTGATLDGVETGDLVTLVAGAAEFYSKSVGENKSVKFSGFTLDGADADNYTLTQPSNGAADITARPITAVVEAADKVYDGTTVASVVSATLIDVFATDHVTLAEGTAAFADRNAGTGKRVSFSGYSLTGADAANYSLTQPADTTADITVRPVSIEGLGAADKVYDGATTALATGTPVIVGAIDGDALSVAAGAAAFADAAAGSWTVSFSGYALDGADAANYALSAQPASTVAAITAKSLASLSIEAIPDETYNGVEHKPAVVVKDGTRALAAAEYAVAYSHNVNAGTAVVTVTGQGNYADAITTTFTILKASQSIAFDAIPDKSNIDADFTVSAVASSGLPVTYASSAPAVADVVYSTGRITIYSVGETAITATQAGNDNYSAAEPVVRTLRVTPANILLSSEKGRIDIAVGEKYPLKVTTQPAGRPLTYTVANDDIAVVDAEGTVIGLRYGETVVTVTADENGASIEITVVVHNVSVNRAVTPSRGFSPNGDGINDLYIIDGILENQPNEFFVFDRDGKVYYQVKNYRNDWDGTANTGSHKGSKVLPGTYFYVLTFDNLPDKTGFIVIKY
jgi:gliding motility-associated-like protein